LGFKTALESSQLHPGFKLSPIGIQNFLEIGHSGFCLIPSFDFPA